MPEHLPDQSFGSQLQAGLDPRSPHFVVDLVDRILRAAVEAHASDIHLLPTPDGLALRFRLDGVLQALATLPPAFSPNIIARLKILAELLTYRTDVPQEGRIRLDAPQTPPAEMRLTTFPTIHGEMAVVRLFGEGGPSRTLPELGLPPSIAATLSSHLQAQSGLILIAGPAGSGKTTTLYACLRALISQSPHPRSIITLEDPVEARVPGAAQSQVNPAVGYNLAEGLRTLVRQDPEVLAIGEIRDPDTAAIAIQAALTGHLVLTTFHAGSASGTLARLLDMNMEPYALRSGLRAVIAQRLLRKSCPCTAGAPRIPTPDPAESAALCPRCRGTAYHGRILIAETLPIEHHALAHAMLQRADAQTLHQIALQAGMIPLAEQAAAAVAQGLTTPLEVARVLGIDAA